MLGTQTRIGCLEVYCRLKHGVNSRPRTNARNAEYEMRESDDFAVDFDPKSRMYLVSKRDRQMGKLTRWRVTYALQPSANQEDVHTTLGETATDWIWDGFNALVIGYGLRGSGRSHTIFGDLRLKDEGLPHERLSPEAGLMMRIITELLCRKQTSPKSSVKMSLAFWTLSDYRKNLDEVISHQIVGTDAAANLLQQASAEIRPGKHLVMRLRVWRGDCLSALTLVEVGDHGGSTGSGPIAKDRISLFRLLDDAAAGSDDLGPSAAASPLNEFIAPMLIGNCKTFLLTCIDRDDPPTREMLDVAQRAFKVAVTCEVTRDPKSCLRQSHEKAPEQSILGLSPPMNASIGQSASNRWSPPPRSITPEPVLYRSDAAESKGASLAQLSSLDDDMAELARARQLQMSIRDSWQNSARHNHLDKSSFKSVAEMAKADKFKDEIDSAMKRIFRGSHEFEPPSRSKPDYAFKARATVKGSPSPEKKTKTPRGPIDRPTNASESTLPEPTLGLSPTPVQTAAFGSTKPSVCDKAPLGDEPIDDHLRQQMDFLDRHGDAVQADARATLLGGTKSKVSPTKPAVTKKTERCRGPELDEVEQKSIENRVKMASLRAREKEQKYLQSSGRAAPSRSQPAEREVKRSNTLTPEDAEKVRGHSVGSGELTIESSGIHMDSLTERQPSSPSRVPQDRKSVSSPQRAVGSNEPSRPNDNINARSSKAGNNVNLRDRGRSTSPVPAIEGSDPNVDYSNSSSPREDVSLMGAGGIPDADVATALAQQGRDNAELRGQLLVLNREIRTLRDEKAAQEIELENANRSVREAHAQVHETMTQRELDQESQKIELAKMTATVRKFEEQTDFADIFAAYETEVDALRGEVDRLKDENLELALGNLTIAAKKEDSVLELTPGGSKRPASSRMAKMLKDLQEEIKIFRAENLELSKKQRCYAVSTRCVADINRKLKASAREIAEKTQQVSMWKKRYQQTEQHLHRITEDNRRCANELELSNRAVNGMAEEITVLKEACLLTLHWRKKDEILTKFLSLGTKRQIERQERFIVQYGSFLRSLAGSSPNLVPLAQRMAHDFQNFHESYIELDRQSKRLYELVTEAAQREARGGNNGAQSKFENRTSFYF